MLGSIIPMKIATLISTMSTFFFPFNPISMYLNKIHECPNDCILYRGAYEHSMACPRCGVSWYRQDVQGDKILEKVLRQMPFLTRITHMFRCGSLAGLMDWHSHNRSTDGTLRIPVDGKAWRHIEKKWPEYGLEPRHLHLGLAMWRR